jgi:hypothetical protein
MPSAIDVIARLDGSSMNAARRTRRHVVGFTFGNPLRDLGIAQAGGDDGCHLVNVPFFNVS